VRQRPAPLVILADSREQHMWTFPREVKIAGRVTPVEVRVCALPSGDYSVAGLQHVAVVERKSVQDLAGTIAGGRNRFDREIARLRLFRFARIVVEGTLDEVRAATAMSFPSILGSLASFDSRAGVATVFAGSEFAAMTFSLGYLRRAWEIETKRASRMRFWMARRRAA
jgi:ERCC4-type nuclease